MRWVPHAAIRPHKCAAIPFIGNHNAKQGFIDTGTDLPGYDPHVYVSLEAVQEMARLIGWVPPAASRQQDQEIHRLTTRVDELDAEAAELRQFKDAAEYTIGAMGSKVRAKPGRKAAV